MVSHELNVNLRHVRSFGGGVSHGEFGVNFAESGQKGHAHSAGEIPGQTRIIKLIDARGHTFPKEIIYCQECPSLIIGLGLLCLWQCFDGRRPKKIA